MPTEYHALLTVLARVVYPGSESATLFTLMAVAITCALTVLLMLSESRGRFNLRFLFLITSFVAVGLAAASLFARIVFLP